MPSLPITLEAALRDARSPDPTARSVAVRHLAAALLGELGDPSPALHLAAGHPLGAAVVAALTAALADPLVAVRAMAATGLGQLGEPDVIPHIDPWLHDADPGPDAGYLRECAAITCVLLGLAAAPEHLVRPDEPQGPAEAPPAAPHPLRPPGHVPSDLSRVTYEAALARITAALRAPAPDLRFQAAGGLVELAGRAAEPALCAALDGEAHPHVRLALVSALAELDHDRFGQRWIVRAPHIDFVARAQCRGRPFRGHHRSGIVAVHPAALRTHAQIQLREQRGAGDPHQCFGLSHTLHRDREFGTVLQRLVDQACKLGRIERTPPFRRKRRRGARYVGAVRNR